MIMAFMKSLDKLLSRYSRSSTGHWIFQLENPEVLRGKYKIWEKFVKDGGMKK